MARAAKKLKAGTDWDGGEQKKKRQKRRRSKQLRGSLKGKTWDQVTAEEKDDILKELAIRFGLVES